MRTLAAFLSIAVLLAGCAVKTPTICISVGDCVMRPDETAPKKPRPPRGEEINLKA